MATASIAKAQAIPAPVAFAHHVSATGTATTTLTWVAPSHNPSYARYALIGVGVGAVTGFVVGVIARRHSTDCNDCMLFSADAIVPLSAAAGAVTGFVGGNVAYLVASANSRVQRESGTIR